MPDIASSIPGRDLRLTSSTSNVMIANVVWRALLTGDLAVSAHEAIRAIARDLPEFSSTADGSLGEGHAGLAVFHAYAARAGIVGDDKAEEHLERAAALLESKPMSPTLYGGFVGVAWAFDHIDSVLDTNADLDINADVDETLLHHVSGSGCGNNHELLYGLTGLAVYALARRPRPIADRLLEAIVGRLSELAEQVSAGLTLVTPASQLPAHWRAHYPMGQYNLGVAHGVPGVIAMLGAVGGAQARRLREGLSAWLFAQRCPAPDGSLYSWSIDGQSRSHRNVGCRAAWCYGDPGIAAALLRSARAAGDPAQEAFALDVGHAAAARSMESAGVVDASLCHGAAGLLHIFNRLYQATGEPAFESAAVRWAAQTLALRDEGVGGFRYYASHDRDRWRDEPGLLNGAAGIGLALLAAIEDVEPRWDTVLLCDIPPDRGLQFLARRC